MYIRPAFAPGHCSPGEVLQVAERSLLRFHDSAVQPIAHSAAPVESVLRRLAPAAGAKHLARALKEHTNDKLTELDLGYNEIKDEGACTLAQVHHQHQPMGHTYI